MAKKAIESIPEGTSFIPADLNPGNIMSQGTDYIFIDLQDSDYGHPLFNFVSAGILLSSSTTYKCDPSFVSPTTGLTVGETHDV